VLCVVWHKEKRVGC